MRGMFIGDEQKAAFYLNNISYYRLKGYWWDMQTHFVNHTFSINSNFEEVIARYNFDRQLRLILFDAIEIIEISLRTKLIYHLSQAYGGLWYLEEALFEDIRLHKRHVEELKIEFARSGEIFAKDFRKKYPTESTNTDIWISSENPDVWIIFEVATFGTLSKIYKNIQHQLHQKSIIANEFGLNLHSELSSWLEAISYLRNIVAHHSRVWGRNMVKRITMPKNIRNSWLNQTTVSTQQRNVKQTKPFLVISTMVYLCNAVNPNNEIKNKLITLFSDNPNIPINKYGFFDNWRQEPIWQ